MESVLEEQRKRPRAKHVDLLRRAREGQQGALDELVHLHFAGVYGFLFRLVGNHEDAEDLAQESFVRAHHSLAWFREDSSFATWIWRIALHLAQDHARRRGRRPKLGSLGCDASDAVVGREPGPQEEVAGRELQAQLDESLERLPHRLRAAIVLRVFEGLEYREVASVMGVTEQTSRALVMKARRQLARQLTPWLDRGGR